MDYHDNTMKGYPERIYVSTQENFRYGSQVELVSVAFNDLDNAVRVGDPVEVGIYQLVRVAKFQKTAVEVKTLKELETIK